MDIRSFLMGAPKNTTPNKSKPKDKPKSPNKSEKSKSKSPNKSEKSKSKSKSIVKAALPNPLPKPKSQFEYIDKSKPQHTDNPPHAGEVEIPNGSPNCLEGIVFTASGTLNSITRQQLKEIITKYGGTLIPKVKEKTDIFIRGVKDVSREKLEEARDNGKSIIDEDGFFEIIRRSIEPIPEETVKPPIQETSIQAAPTKIQKEEKTKAKPKPKKEVSPFAIPESCPTEFPSQEITEDAHPGSQPLTANIPEKNPIFTLFTEKYRPKVFSDLVGNTEGVKKLRDFLRNFNKQEKKSVVIYGPPGIGKTTSAIIAAKTEGYHVLEYNASDTRNKKSVEEESAHIFNNQTLFKYNENSNNNLRTCIIFDEVDGMTSGDRGGIQALVKFIKTTKVPIICICNDGYNKKLTELKKYSIEIPFSPLTSKEDILGIAKRLSKICELENIPMNRKKYLSIINKSAGDIRSALNSLQFWNSGIEESAAKDIHEDDPFQAIVTLFKPNIDLDQRINLFFIDYDSMPAFVHQYCTMNEKRKDPNNVHTWFEAIDSMAYGNEMENLIRGENAWDLLNPLGIVSTAIPTFLCPKYTKIYRTFPEDFSRASKQNSLSRDLRDISMRCRRSCGAATSNSFRDSIADLIVLKFNNLVENKRNLEALDMLDEMELTKDDIINLQNITSNFPQFSEMIGATRYSDASNKSFAQLYKEKHPEIKKDYKSNEDERADFYINKTAKKKKSK